MKSVLDEIRKLRKNNPLNIDKSNKNRHRIVVWEPRGEKTAYCFSPPVYDLLGNLVDLKFTEQKDGIFFKGSSAEVVANDILTLKNKFGRCHLTFACPFQYKSEGYMVCGSDVVFPTLNGIAYKAKIKNQEPFSFFLECEDPFLEVRENDKCFALMREQFKPFVTVSCIGVLDQNGSVIAPVKISSEKKGGQLYLLQLEPQCAEGEWLFFEINLYEPKLLQDTTVESRHPRMNNAFGGVAFVGTTESYGEQWLYIRPEFSTIVDLMNKRVQKVVLHFPKLGANCISISAFNIAARFCSFGSRWRNKVAQTSEAGKPTWAHRHLRLDITRFVVDPIGKQIKTTPGILLKPKTKGDTFSVFSTGDHYFAPVIMEIRYRD